MGNARFNIRDDDIELKYVRGERIDVVMPMDGFDVILELNKRDLNFLLLELENKHG